MRLLPPMAAAVLAGVVCTSCTPGQRKPSLAPVVTAEGVRFSLPHPDANSVALAGTFNEWSTSSHPMIRQGTSRVWVLVVPMPPGKHLFMYVVDGTQWLTPPVADDFMDDGFGSQNGVIVVLPER